MRPRDPKLFSLAQDLVRRFVRGSPPINLEVVKTSREFAALYRHVDSAGLVDKFGFSKTDSSGKPVPNDASDLLRTYVSPFLGDCLGEPNGPAAGFRRFYPHLEESLLADASIWVFLAPLLNFRATTAHIQVVADVHIRHLSHDEVDKLSEIADSVAPGHHLEGKRLCCVALKQSRPKGAPMLGFGEEMFLAPLTALRLLKAGDVQIGVPTMHRLEVGIEWIEGPPYGTIGRPGQLAGSGMARRGGGVVFSLWRTDRSLLSALTQRLQSGVARNVQTALDRFNLSYGRGEATDRIIDYWISLEALFLPGFEGEKSYRAALRVASFVGRSSKDRMQIYRQARESYEARSWLVHGQQEGRKKSKKSFDFERIAVETGANLRRALRVAVLNPGEPNIDRLETSVVSGKRYAVKNRSAPRTASPPSP